MDTEIGVVDSEIANARDVSTRATAFRDTAASYFIITFVARIAYEAAMGLGSAQRAQPRARGAWQWCLCVGLWMVSGVARADAPALQPPRLSALPALTLPSAVPSPEGGVVRAVVAVAADGSASLEACAASSELCALVSDTIAAAHFEPARRDGIAIAARVSIVLRVREDAANTPDGRGSLPPSAAERVVGDAGVPAPSADLVTGPPPSAADAAVQPPSAADPEPNAYAAQARTRTLTKPGARRLELAEMRDLPGALGDPFRAVETLPGVVPLLSGLPYFYLRGSPPSGMLYAYDGIPVPTLFHVGLGPAVIHPRMVGSIQLYSGVAPARFGRLTGGVVTGEGPERGDGHTHAELELRLLDVSGYVQTAAVGGTLTAAARYGYPGLIATLAVPDLNLGYWDYQLRYSSLLSPHARFELVALGSYDSLSMDDKPEATMKLQFHLLEPRFIHADGPDELGVAMTLGWEQSALVDKVSVSEARVAPRAWYEHRFAAQSWLRLSADIQAVAGQFVNRGSGSDFSYETLVITQPSRSGVATSGGAAVELTLRPWQALELQLGARADAWLQASRFVAAFDPRLRAIVHLDPSFELHLASGLAHQPAVPYIPLPGIADFIVPRPLQSVWQSEVGVGWDTPIDLHAELQVFAHRYHNLVFGELSERDDLCSAFECKGGSAPPRIESFTYGMELFIRRPITHALSGFVSYTLAWSKVEHLAGVAFTPSWDVRHVANLVLQWQIGGGFSAGARAFFRSGRVDLLGDSTQGRAVERRLPGFVRVDVDVAYAWRTYWGRMRVALEFFNASLSAEPSAWCGVSEACSVSHIPALFLPNLSVRGEL